MRDQSRLASIEALSLHIHTIQIVAEVIETRVLTAGPDDPAALDAAGALASLMAYPLSESALLVEGLLYGELVR